MDELNVSVNTEELAEPQQSDVSPDTSGSVEVAEPQQENKPVQTPEQNALFAKVRREAEQAARDRTIAEMGMEFNGKPITTYEQYQQALAEQRAYEEAQNLGVDPKFYNEFTSMKSKLDSIEREKTLLQQDTTLENDPKLGTLYKEWKDDVHALSDTYNCDYDTAFTLMLRDKAADIINKTKFSTEQETVRKLQGNASSTPGALSSESSSNNVNISKMSKTDFDEMVERAKRGEIRSL